MTKLKIFGLLLTVCVSLAMADDTSKEPIGYVAENPAFEDDADFDKESTPPTLTVIRDGKTLDLRATDEIYAGDILKTNDKTDISVAFVDRSAVRLLPSSEVHLSAGAAITGLSGATVIQGHVSVAFDGPSKTARELTLGVGERSTRAKTPTTADPVKLDILVNKDASGNTFTTTVAALKGIAILTPNGKGDTVLKGGGSNIMTFHSPVDKVSGSTEVQIAAVNLTKDQIAALHGSAVSEFFVSAGKGKVQIKGTEHNIDGTITTVQESIANDVTTKNSTTTKDANKKTVTSFKQSGTKVQFTRLYEGYSLKASMTTSAAGKGSVKGPAKDTYTGTTTFDANTGNIVFTSTKPSKAGDNIIMTYSPSLNGQSVTTVIKIPKSGPATQTQTSLDKSTGVQTKITQTGTIVGGKFVSDGTPPVKVVNNFTTGPKNPTLPDGHEIGQDNPPPVVTP